MSTQLMRMVSRVERIVFINMRIQNNYANLWKNETECIVNS